MAKDKKYYVSTEAGSFDIGMTVEATDNYNAVVEAIKLLHGQYRLSEVTIIGVEEVNND